MNQNGLIHPSQDENQSGDKSLRLRTFWDTAEIATSVTVNESHTLFDNVEGKGDHLSNMAISGRLPAGHDATILRIRAEVAAAIATSTGDANFLIRNAIFRLYLDSDDLRWESPLGSLPSGISVGGVNQFDSVANTGTSVIYLAAPSNGNGEARNAFAPEFQIGLNDGKSFRGKIDIPVAHTLDAAAQVRIYLDVALWRSVR